MIPSSAELRTLLSTLQKSKKSLNPKVRAGLSSYQKEVAFYVKQLARFSSHKKYSLKTTDNAGAIEMVKFGVNGQAKSGRVFYLLDTEGPEEGLFVMPAELGELENTFKAWKQGEKVPDDLLRVLDTYTTWDKNNRVWKTTDGQDGEKKMQIVETK
jgi:hypothetical protein